MDADPDSSNLSVWLPIANGEILHTDGVRITQMYNYGSSGKHYSHMVNI